jgi:hypothetical protein
MPFRTIELPSLEAFLSIAVAPIESVVIYRGVSDASYDLLPSVGRWKGPEASRIHFLGKRGRYPILLIFSLIDVMRYPGKYGSA